MDGNPLSDMWQTLQVQKSAGHYTEAARDEIEMLQRIAAGPPARSRHCVRLLDSFDHRGPNGLHVCMVFEVRAGLWVTALASCWRCCQDTLYNQHSGLVHGMVRPPELLLHR